MRRGRSVHVHHPDLRRQHGVVRLRGGWPLHAQHEMVYQSRSLPRHKPAAQVQRREATTARAVSNPTPAPARSSRLFTRPKRRSTPFPPRPPYYTRAPCVRRAPASRPATPLTAPKPASARRCSTRARIPKSRCRSAKSLFTSAIWTRTRSRNGTATRWACGACR